LDRDKYPTIYHIDIDAFFASVEESLDPSLAGRAVIVGGLATDRGVVACPNYEARRLGVKTAMPLSDARVLAPRAVFIRGKYKTYTEYSRKFIDILKSFSPAVQSMSLDEAYLDANGCLHFWNYDPVLLARRLKEKIRAELNISVSIGVASNKMCAKVATDFSKRKCASSGKTGPPGGLHIVWPGEEKNFLAPLPVSAMPGIGRRTTEILNGLGILTLGELASSDRRSLCTKLGIVGAHLHKAANGSGGVEVTAGYHIPKSISRGTTFGEDSDDEDYIRSMIFYLSEKISSELRENDLSATTISVKLRYSHGAPLLGFSKNRRFTDRTFITYQKNFTFKRPTSSVFEISASAFALIRSIWLSGTRVRYIGVGISNIAHELHQPDLFEPVLERDLDLMDGIDRVRNKFGYDALYFGIVEQVKRRHREDRPGFNFNLREAANDNQVRLE